MNWVFLANLETAISIVHDASIRYGDAVVVFGLGVVGILAGLVLKKSGARPVIGVDPFPSRREKAAELGIEDTIDLRNPKLGDNLSKLSSTGDGFADILIDCSGSPAALQQAIDFSGFESRIITASWYGDKQVKLNLGRKFHRNRNVVVSSQVSNLNPQISGRWNKARRINLCSKLLSEVGLGLLITDVFPFEKAQDAYRKIDQKPDEILQVVLDYTTR
jgi:threonine dehydrogenase-like Zn-dependent dehydrogenase